MIEPPAPQFTVRQGEAAGLTRAQMRGATLVAPFTGVRAVPDGVRTHRELCRAAALVLPDGSAFSHVTALRLHGIEVPWQLEGDARIHVVSPERRIRRRRDRFAPHFCAQRALEIVSVEGLAVTSPAQTWLHLGHRLLPDDVVVLADSMLRRRDPHTTLDELRRLMAATHKMRGLVRCREAIGRVRPRTDSSMETRTRLVLESAGFTDLVVNGEVTDAGGRFVALVDLSIPGLRIAIEYEGDVHRTDVATWRKDVERRQRLQDLGWLVIEVTADDVLRSPDRLIARVRAAVAHRSTHPARR